MNTETEEARCQAGLEKNENHGKLQVNHSTNRRCS